MKDSEYSNQFRKHRINKSSPTTASPHPSPKNRYKANTFNINLYDDWQDKTVFTITGPVTDGIQHNITIMVEHDIEVDSLRDFADWNVSTLENELKGCRILKQGEINLDNGIPAYKVVYVWYPTDKLRLYQEQIILLVDKTSYKLTASFTRKSRKILGPQVERMMLSFKPIKP